MRKPSILRVLLTVALTATLLAPVACGKEKKIKECAEKCQAESEACSKRHDKDCAGLANKCAEQCEKI